MSFVKWIVNNKFMLVKIYVGICVLLHIPIVLMVINHAEGLVTAGLMLIFGFPTSIAYYFALELLFDMNHTVRAIIESILAITTNTFILIGLITLLGKIFKVSKQPEIAE